MSTDYSEDTLVEQPAIALFEALYSGSPRPQLAWGRGAGGEGAER